MIVFEVIISQEIISFMRFFLFSFITVIQPVVLRILLLFIILDQFFEGLTQSFLLMAAFAIMFFVVYSWVSVEQSWLVQNFQIKQINYRPNQYSFYLNYLFALCYYNFNRVILPLIVYFLIQYQFDYNIQNYYFFIIYLIFFF